MKKIFSILALLMVGLVLVACGPTVKEDGALTKLETARDGMDILISDPSNITTNFVVPSKLAGGITATWTSDAVSLVSFGTPNATDEVTATVNRPAKGQGDATVKITATLKLKSELNDDMLEVKWEKTLTVKENTVEEINIENIADILAITDEAYDGGTYSVDIPNVTIFAKGDVFFGYDGTGIIQLFNSQTSFEVGKVYDVTGALEWYFGIWELVQSTGTEKTGATAQYPDKVTIDSVDAKIAELNAAGEYNYPNVADGNFEPIYATVTGNIFMISGDTGNYNTYIIDAAKDALVLGEPNKPASGFMFYYGTNDFPYVRGFAGYEVEMDVVIYTYRSNNLAYAVYYVGGPEGITANLNETQKVDVAKTNLTLPNQVYKADQTLNLIATSGEVAVTWAFKDSEDANNALVNLTDGKVTLPTEGQVDVTLVATLTLGETTQTKEFTIKIGDIPVSTVAQVAAATVNTYKFKIVGTVLGYNGHRQISIADETGAITVYHSVDGAADLAALVGKQVEIIGTRTVYSGLIQLGSPEIKDLELDGTMPAAKDLTEVAVWDAESLLPFQAGLVSLANLKVTAVGENDYGNVDLTLEDQVTLKTIKFFWDSRQPLVGSSDFIAGLKVGDFVSFENALLTWRSGNPALAIHNANQAAAGIEVTLTTTEKFALAEATLDALLKDKEFNMDSEIALPTSGLYGVEISWTIDPTTAIADGKWAVVEADTEVTLTATLSLGEESDELVYEVTVKLHSAETFTETFTDAATALAVSGTGYDDLTYTGVGGVTWTFVHVTDEDGGSNGVYEIDGTTVVLRRANEPSSISATFADGISAFSFEYMKAFTGGRVRTYSVDVTNDGETITYEITPFGEGTGAQDDVFTFTYDGPALSGEVTITIYATGSDGNQQASFDNFTWTTN